MRELSECLFYAQVLDVYTNDSFIVRRTESMKTRLGSVDNEARRRIQDECSFDSFEYAHYVKHGIAPAKMFEPKGYVLGDSPGWPTKLSNYPEAVGGMSFLLLCCTGRIPFYFSFLFSQATPLSDIQEEESIWGEHRTE